MAASLSLAVSQDADWSQPGGDMHDEHEEKSSEERVDAPAVASSSAAAAVAAVAGAPAKAAQPPRDFFLEQLKEATGLDLLATFAAADAAQPKGGRSSSGVARPWPLRDPGTLKMRLEKALQAMSRASRRIFIDGLRDFITDEVTFTRLLLPTQQVLTEAAASRAFTLSQHSKTTANRSSIASMPQDSLMRILLLVEPIQIDIVQVLLEKLRKIDSSEQGSSSPLASLILTQLRYPDQVYDPHQMAAEITTTMERLYDEQVLSAMIQAVPDLISTNEHAAMVKTLLGLWENFTQHTSAILETLLHLQMNVSTTTATIDKMLDAVPHKPVADLPMIVKFIVQASGNLAELQTQQQHQRSGMGAGAASSAGASSRKSTIDHQLGAILVRLRAQLNLSPLVSASQDITFQRQDKAKAKASRDASAPLLTIESLQQSIRFHAIVGAVWLKELKKIAMPAEHTPVDIWMLFILFAFPNHKAAVLKLIKKKLMTGALTVDNFTVAIETHADVVHSLFATIMHLCEALLRDSTGGDKSHLVHRTAVKLQSACFTAFTDYADRLVILDAFVRQIANNKVQADVCHAALAELWHLVQNDARAVEPYQEQLHSLIDYLHSFEPEQQRILAEILAGIAVREERHAASDDRPLGSIYVDAKLHITCHKHLRSSVVDHHRIGVAFVAAQLKTIGMPILNEESQLVLRGGEEHAQLTVDLFRTTWREALESIAKMGPAHADTRRTQLFDAMAIAVDEGAIHTHLFDVLIAETSAVLQEYHRVAHFPLELESDALKEAFECTPTLLLNIDLESPRPIHILPMLADPKTRDAQHRLTAAMRLHFACAKRGGRLKDLEKLAISPFYGFEMPRLNEWDDSMTSTHHLKLSTLLHMLNCVRVEASALAFASSDDEVKKIAATRFCHAVKLLEKLEHLTKLTSDTKFVPYGLQEDEKMAVKADAIALGKKMKEMAAKAKKTDAAEKIDYVEAVRQSIVPFGFDILHLLNLELSFAPDATIAQALKSSTKKSKKLLDGGASAAASSEAHVCPVNDGTLTIQMLDALLAHLEAMMNQAEADAHEPLVRAKFQAPNLDPNADEPINTSEAMTFLELTKALMPMWPALGRHAHAIIEHLAQRDAANAHQNGDEDNPHESRETIEKCLEKLVLFATVLLKYAESHDDEQFQLIEAALAAFVSTFESQAQAHLTPRLRGLHPPGSFVHSSRALMYLLVLIPINDLEHGVILLDGMDSIVKHAGMKDDRLASTLHKHAAQLLTREWAEKQKVNVHTVGHVVQIYLRHADDFEQQAGDLINTITSVIRHQRQVAEESSLVEDLPEEEAGWANLLTGKTAPFYVRPILEQLVEKVQSLKSNQFETSEMVEFFQRLSSYTGLMKSLAILLEFLFIMPTTEGEKDAKLDVPLSPALLTAVLKQGKTLLEFGLKKHQELFQEHAKKHSRQIKDIFTQAQKFANLMQYICTYGKKHNVAGLMAHIPSAKSAVESLFQMVRTFCIENDIQFETGTLKSKNLPEPKPKKAPSGGRKRKKKVEEEEEEEGPPIESDEEEEPAADEEPAEEDDDDLMEDAEQQQEDGDETESEIDQPPAKKSKRA